MSTAHSALSRRDLFRCGAGVVAAGALGLPALAAADAAAAPPATPAEAFARLAAGNARFTSGAAVGPARTLARLKEVAPQQKPFSAFLGCADSRVPIEIAYDQGFGDLFVVRVAGNIATPVEIASLEFGTLVLGCKTITVLGHSGCGAVKAALAGAEVPGQISALFQYIVPAIDRQKMDLAQATVANVRYQMRKLRDASPVLSRLVGEGKVAIAGGVFDIATGTIAPVEG